MTDFTTPHARMTRYAFGLARPRARVVVKSTIEKVYACI